MIILTYRWLPCEEVDGDSTEAVVQRLQEGKDYKFR